MEKSRYIIFLSIVVIPMVVSTSIETISESTSEKTTMKSIISSYINSSRLDRTDENIFQETPNSFLQMKTIKLTFQKILDILNNITTSTISETLEKITFEINSITKKLNETGINLYDESIIKTISKVVLIRDVHEDLKVLSSIINDIDYLFKNYYLEYLNRHTSNASVHIFISKAMGLDADSPRKSVFMLKKIAYSKVDGPADHNLLETIFNAVNMSKEALCSTRQTPQQLIYNLYLFFATIELKAYIMVVSAYKLHSVTSNDNYTEDFERIQAEHLRRMNNYLTIFSDALDKSSTEMIACSAERKEENNATQIKAINKLPKESDYHNNKVVTGVRFVIKNEMLHLQMEEGQLIPNGQIVPGSEQWIPIDDMNYADRTVIRNGQVARMHECIEYHSLTSTDYWYLNDVLAPPNFVVIGANLEVHTSESTSDKIIYLRLKFAKVDFTTAKVDPIQEKYSDDLEYVPLELRDLNLANNAGYVSLREKDTHRDEYINNYGYRRIMIVPFINLQAVYGEPRLPFMGIGTFKRNSTESNTIVLKAFGFNFSSLIDIN